MTEIMAAAVLLFCTSSVVSAQVFVTIAAFSGHLQDESFYFGTWFYTNSNSACPTTNPCVVGLGGNISGTARISYQNAPLGCGTVSPTQIIVTDSCGGKTIGNQLILNYADPVVLGQLTRYSFPSGSGTYGYGAIQSLVSPQVNIPISNDGGVEFETFTCSPEMKFEYCPSGPLSISTTTLPNATSGQPYTQQLLGVGGSGLGYVWSQVSGKLPLGFKLTSTGSITSNGSPAATPGSYHFSVQVGDSASAIASQPLTLIVNPTALPAVTILDPVPDLLLGAEITNVRETLAANGRQVAGIAADGIAQVVFRVPTVAAETKVSATLFSNCTTATDPTTCTFSGSTDDDGGVFNIYSSLDEVASTASDVSDSTTHDAFIAYRAPVDFVRLGTSSDQDLASRMVYLKLSYSSGSTVYGAQMVPLVIVRPPVTLIHGIFSDPSVFDDFSPVVGNNSFFISVLDYSDDIDDQVTGTVPDYTRTRLLAPIKRNVVGVEYNAPLLLESLITQINSFKQYGPPSIPIPVASVQADVIAHSLGGLMARGMSRVGTDFAVAKHNFYGSQTYAAGYIHKLITLGTPHLGTPLASDLTRGDIPGLQGTASGGNDCTRDSAAIFGNYSLNSVSLNGKPFYGAAFDLSGDPLLGSLSPTLEILNRPRAHTIPTSLIAGYFTGANKSSFLALHGLIAQTSCGTKTVTQVQTPPFGTSIHLGSNCGSNPHCKVRYGDFLADNYSFDQWTNIFDGRHSDALVSVDSASFGLSGEFVSTRPGVVHGPGTVGNGSPRNPNIGFAGPHLLDPASSLSIKALGLLNTSVRDISSFINIP